MIKRRICGFTLLEVMIALAVLALSATAVLRQTSQSIQQTQYLEQKTFALWLAENKLAELRAGKDWPSLGRETDREERFGRSWRLDVEVFSTADAWLRRIEVKVGVEENDSNLLTLQGFIGRY